MKFLCLLLLALAINARPHHGGHGGRGGGPHIRGIGPLNSVLDKLSNNQRKQLGEIVKSHDSDKKSDFKKAIADFTEKLPEDLKKEVDDDKKNFEEKKAKNVEKSEKLGKDGKKLFDDIEAVLKDDSLTFEEEHKKIREISKSADPKVLKELRKAHIFLPGLRGHHGGPLFKVYKDLSDEQKQKLDKVLETGHDKPKKEAKAELDKFVESLPDKLKKKVEDGKKKREEHKKENEEKVKKLSKDAQDLFNKVQKAKDDDSLTFKQSHDNIRDILLNADKNTVEELRKAKVNFFDFGPHGHRGGHKGKNNNTKQDSKSEESSETSNDEASDTSTEDEKSN